MSSLAVMQTVPSIDSDFPAAVELGLLRPSGLHVERFRNRFDIQ